ncbi:hypothetical protein PI125_g22134 [Phytophthora idaei]|nr:hypothetical protein PI125_g22134 [Phytophthora idaei]KAG3130903.1 hypothetical protein PI126_g20291 [Phytophthora idaei]
MSDVAEAVINHMVDPVNTLSGVVLILPLPPCQGESKQQTPHPRFAPL